VLVIVAISLIAIMAMLVLSVDVGGLLLNRRGMVNASDAAALAAAQSCANSQDSATPEDRADAYAMDNVPGLSASDGGITTITGCHAGSGYLSVQYTNQQPLFFAGILGFGSKGNVTTAATAAWGPLASGAALPIVLDSGYLQGTCKVPDGIQIGDTCDLWYNNGGSTLGAANWGFMNLDEWNVSPSANCSNAGSSSRNDWIVNGYPSLLGLNGAPAGTAPTYVCNDTGHSSSDWSTLKSQEGLVKLFPVNDCSGQLDKNGQVTTCPSTPDKYDIIGFTDLLVLHVYKGNDPLAIAAGGACAGHRSDPNAICLVTQWEGFTTGAGGVGGGTSFGAESVALCDRSLQTCPGQ
jgi:Putative Flp pilus-assembly TadE/G-like